MLSINTIARVVVNTVRTAASPAESRARAVRRAACRSEAAARCIRASI